MSQIEDYKGGNVWNAIKALLNKVNNITAVSGAIDPSGFNKNLQGQNITTPQALADSVDQLPIPTKTSEIANDSNFIDSSTLNTALALKAPLSSPTFTGFVSGITSVMTGSEPSLGLPSTNGYILSSTTSGTRSWIPMTGATSWGTISGTLSNQTDLNTALGLKAPLASPTFTGTVSGITSTMVGLGSVDNTADSTKNVLSATKLTTPRTINSVSFDGTTNITIVDSTKEPTLGNPASNGYILSSTISGTRSWITPSTSMVYPGSGIPNSTGSAWGTSYTTSGSGTVLALTTSPSFTTPSLGAATATSINGATINSSINSLAGLTYASASFVKMTAANTFALDTSTYLTTAGNAATATKSTNLIGGNSTTLLGSIPYQSNTDTTTLLSPNITTTKNFLSQTGTGTNGAIPAWGALVNADIPTTLTGKTYNAITLTAATTGFTIAGGTTSKTLTLNNTLAFSGTDSSTLNIGSGGTLGTAAYTATTAYEAALGNPGTSGYVLSSTTAGVRSWVANGGGSMVYPGSGIANSTGSAWSTSYTTSGTGTVLALTASPTFTGTLIGETGSFSGIVSTPNLLQGYAATTTAAGTTTLTSTSNYFQLFSGSSTQTIVLPGTGITSGLSFYIYNLSNLELTVNTSGGSLVTYIPASGKVLITYASGLTSTGWYVVSSIIGRTDSVTSGLYNTTIGTSSLSTSTTGNNNTGIGYNVLHANTSGSSNMAFGSSALGQNTTGSSNSAIGVYSLYGNTTGVENVGLGYGTLTSIVNTSGNTAIGTRAGQSSTSSYGLFLGYYAGRYDTDGALAFYVNTIDQTSATLDKTNSLMYGKFNSVPTSQTLAINAQTKVFHLGGTLVSAPTLTAGTGAGTSPTITITGTDVAGVLNITTGTSPTGSNATIVTVTFNVAFGTAPYVVFSPINSVSAALTSATSIYVTSTTSTFLLKSGATALTASTVYQWNYMIIQ